MENLFQIIKALILTPKTTSAHDKAVLEHYNNSLHYANISAMSVISVCLTIYMLGLWFKLAIDFDTTEKDEISQFVCFSVIVLIVAILTVMFLAR